MESVLVDRLLHIFAVLADVAVVALCAVLVWTMRDLMRWLRREERKP